ncbi:MAG TPA: type II secretion system protein [Candidatus Saccharimonadales bacterium]|nr:type II secretion system protein [Candidatus Saccharimonadales bacterium]
MGNIKKLAINAVGFTLVELILAISLVSIISVGLISLLFNDFAIMTRNNSSLDMSVDSQNLLRSTVEALRYGAGVRQTNTIADTNAPGGGWTTSNTDFVIIIAVPVVDNTRSYIIDGDTGSPYLNELVYYKNGSTLLRRSLANPDAVGNSLKSSCPANLATSACPADQILVDNVKTMLFTLYDQDNASTEDPLIARSIKIDLSMEKDTFGAPLTLVNSIRVTLRNAF